MNPKVNKDNKTYKKQSAINKVVGTNRYNTWIIAKKFTKDIVQNENESSLIKPSNSR